ncbi:hypothetical protein CKA34_10555 [Rhizobium sp. 11515TR]|nr:hypothetical protein CKA34_10555 [Rhizobium sp. 11515TR]
MDPPYHLTSIVERFGPDDAKPTKADGATGVYKRSAAGFMGKQWDGGDIAFQVETWKAVYRVLKPGAYLLSFASTRGFGEMSVAIKGAGFVTHPLIDYFVAHPDGHDFLSTLSTHQLDAFLRLMDHNDLGGMLAWTFGSGFPKATRINAEGYDGWRYGGQALKPAIEPIYMGQKPFSEKTGTANVLLHGTGAINIDGCRVGNDGGCRSDTAYIGGDASNTFGRGLNDQRSDTVPGLGRWPANLIHDGSAEVIEVFPEAPGQQREVNDTFKPKQGTAAYGDYGPRPTVQPRDDGGSAARFFYSAKADADDRIGSKHPTVKPIDLLRYLVRLVTPPGGTVLDCFAGTGTTGEAAWREGFNAILIEREPEYQQDIAERMRLCLAGPDEKKREIIKRRGLADDDAGPLFGGAA